MYCRTCEAGLKIKKIFTSYARFDQALLQRTAMFDVKPAKIEKVLISNVHLVEALLKCTAVCNVLRAQRSR